MTTPISSPIWDYTFCHSIATLTLCVLMDFPIHINTINMGLLIMYFKGLQVEFSYDVFLSLNIVLNLANSADPDEMQHYAAFHLGSSLFAKVTS